MKQTNHAPGGARLVFTYAAMVLLTIVMILPFLWMVSTSLKSQEYILTATPQFIPNPVTLESYVELFERIHIGRTFFNSLLVAVVGTAGQVLIAAMAAFAFSRIEWRGRDNVFILYLATMMLPAVVLVLPQFALIRSLGWINTYAALNCPHALRRLWHVLAAPVVSDLAQGF